MLNTLKTLCSLNGVSGWEDAVSDYIYDTAKLYADEISRDSIGNIFVFKKGKHKTKKPLMICAHMDEVGLIIKSITDDGYLKFDFVGGVDVDVDEEELKDINVNYIPYLQRMGIKCELIEKAGKQHLTGGQAVAYCRVRHVGGTTARGERHQEVLMALFEQSKSLSATKYPELASLILKECSTSMSNSEIMSLGMWAVKNFGSLEFETLGIPTAEIDRGEIIDGVWYHTYSLERATEIIHDFILEPEN